MTAQAGAMTARDLRWAFLVHPTSSLWGVRKATHLACDDQVWDQIITAAAAAGVTTLIIDLADAVLYRSHPELAIDGSWTREDLRRRLDRVRQLGMDPVPKLNFSTNHHAWLGDYSRMVSSQPYYAVCLDLIDEAGELFDQPALFHLGMDEESIYTGDPRFEYVIGRRRGLWWHDVNFFLDRVVQNGSRPWVWADEAWSQVGAYYARMGRQVLQSNWYYHEEFAGDPVGRPRPLDYRLQETHLAFLDLEDHGFDQMPCGSTWLSAGSFARLVDYCTEHIAPERLQGFVMATWRTMTEEHRDAQFTALDVIAEVRRSIT